MKTYYKLFSPSFGGGVLFETPDEVATELHFLFELSSCKEEPTIYEFTKYTGSDIEHLKPSEE